MKAKLTLQQVNQITDHTRGSVIEDEYYSKPDHPPGIEYIVN